MNAEVTNGRAPRRTVFLIAGLLLYAVAFSCGPSDIQRDAGSGGGNGGLPDSGSVDGGSVGDGGLNAQNACALMNSRKCDFLQRCGLIPEGQPALRDCASILVTTECGPSLWPLRVQVGTLRFSATIARGCAESYTIARCEDFAQVPELCREFLTPGSALNTACYGGIFRECQSGVCRGLSCPRLCRPPGTFGEDCNVNGDCATDAGLYCAPGGTSSSGTCAAFGGVDAGCSALTRCGSDLYCAVDGRCRTLRNMGDGCSEGTCVSGNWCALGADGGGVCTAKSPPGTACTDDRQCLEGSVCVAESRVCGSKGPLPRDSSCGTGQSCSTGLSCVGVKSNTLGMCTAPITLGETCGGQADCEQHLACIAPDGGAALQCDKRRDDGAPCTFDRDCRLYSACRGGGCIRLPRLGEACTNNECVYGSCTESASDGGRSCSGLLPPNAPCTFDAECSSNRCAANACLAACTP